MNCSFQEDGRCTFTGQCENQSETLCTLPETSQRRSEFNPNFSACPRCGWPIEPEPVDVDNGGMTCACGAWVEIVGEVTFVVPSRAIANRGAVGI